MIYRHVRRPTTGPFLLQRPTRLTWSKVSRPAHENPVNGLFAYSPIYSPVTHGPLGPTRNWPNSIMWAVEYNIFAIRDAQVDFSGTTQKHRMIRGCQPSFLRQVLPGQGIKSCLGFTVCRSDPISSFSFVHALTTFFFSCEINIGYDL